jgi:nucleoside-diphosphate-sugar epimerase
MREVAALQFVAHGSHTGDLNLRRDFLDVRDAVRAYYCLLADGAPGEAYNVCSAFPCLLTDVVDALKNMAGVDFDLALKKGLGHSGQPSTVVGDFCKNTETDPLVPYDSVGSNAAGSA